MAKQIIPQMIRQAMAAMGSKGGKRSLETMTPEQRADRAKKASEAAAKKRTADRLTRERAAKRTPERGKAK
jgi:hypothetical protein